MVELIATIAITVSSAVLFGYWFRYTSLLILSAKTPQDYAGEVAMTNQLSFLTVQSQLRQLRQHAPELEALQKALDRDYAIVTYLLEHVSSASAVEEALEKRMLKIDYRLMRAWYLVSRNFSSEAARNALEEMSQVVAHFANVTGARAAAGAAA
jgi:hypothetical protein